MNIVILEEGDALDVFLDEFKNTESILIPNYIRSDLHPGSTSLCFLFVCIKNQGYVLNFKHPDVTKKISDLVLSNLKNDHPVYVLHKKDFMYQQEFFPNLNFSKLYDINSINYFNTNHQFDIQPLDESLSYNTSLSKHIEYYQEIIKMVKVGKKLFTIDNSFKYFNFFYFNSLYFIEKNGIKIDCDLFNINFKQNLSVDKVYTKYNPYTITSRPSNTFNNINYAAIPKNEIRKSFIPENDIFIQFDYKSYHPFLIMQLTSIKLDGVTNFYEYLAGELYGESEVTQETISNSKQYFFKFFYGGNIPDELLEVPLFKTIYEYIDKIWIEFEIKGFIKTPILKRKLYIGFYTKLNKFKLFNYLIQATETEKNMLMIYKLSEYMKLHKLKSNIVLYTYDSILIDYSQEDGKDHLLKLKMIMEDKIFPVHVTYGKNYYEIS